MEAHYVFNPQLIFIQRDEFVRMSQQALTTTPGNLGNINAYTFAFRYYPFMFSRAGFAYHAEYAMMQEKGAAPITALHNSATAAFSWDSTLTSEGHPMRTRIFNPVDLECRGGSGPGDRQPHSKRNIANNIDSTWRAMSAT